MEQSCQKCGAEVNAGQAFCPKCGAVVGMGDAGRAGGGADDELDLESTFFDKKAVTAPLTKPRSTAERAAQAAAGAPAPTKPYAAARGGNGLLFAVLGFVAVLLAGGLLILLLYMNSKG
jgi:hypothetical protein